LSGYYKYIYKRSLNFEVCPNFYEPSKFNLLKKIVAKNKNCLTNLLNSND